VQHAAHIVELEELGGLLRRMPWTGTCFLIGSAAIVGLPPLNGFVSEFLLVYSGYAGLLLPSAPIASAGLIVLVAMGLIGGLAAACFAKAFGIVFLGAPRSREAELAHETARPMLAAMVALASLCVAIGFAGPLIVPALSGIVEQASGLPSAEIERALRPLAGALTSATAVFAGLTVLTVFLWLARSWRLARAGVRRAPVWGCGIQHPTPRMQYTASSFAQPLVTQFHLLIANREALAAPAGYFPERGAYASDSGDPFLRLLVDKQHPLPDGYEPDDLVELENGSYRTGRAGLMLRSAAAAALDEMAWTARAEGLTLVASSTYRSYDYQVEVYSRNVREMGQAAADRESARPGYSQHQLGLIVDFGSITDAFAETKEGIWLAANASRFGWSLSFPDGYEETTGYRWECWHYRYVGKELAEFIDNYFDGIQQYALQFINEWERESAAQ
jgi:D-alanyl-D-alanine carboxypeptidase